MFLPWRKSHDYTMREVSSFYLHNCHLFELFTAIAAINWFVWQRTVKISTYRYEKSKIIYLQINSCLDIPSSYNYFTKNYCNSVFEQRSSCIYCYFIKSKQMIEHSKWANETINKEKLHFLFFPFSQINNNKNGRIHKSPWLKNQV